ncbi:MAG TPA: hypothetical protein VFS58_10685 [Steroidobacteraceae bacterium]|nr:hypothetical protein [Steroidobacteraceae bacterium]
MPCMYRAQYAEAAGQLSPARPLMTAEVLDAAYRLFRAGIFRCLPYSGLAVLVLELPTLYSTFIVSPAGKRAFDIPYVRLLAYATIFLSSVALLGVITLRLTAVAQGLRPRFRRELAIALKRLPTAALATLFAFAYPMLLLLLAPVLMFSLPAEAVIFVAVPLVWPVALFVVALPAFWCDGLGPFAAIAQALRVSFRRSWRPVGAILTTGLMLMAFTLLPVTVAAMLSPLFGRVDLFLVATIASIFYLVLGAFGVPFVLAVLIVAYQDLKLRDQERRGVKP